MSSTHFPAGFSGPASSKTAHVRSSLRSLETGAIIAKTACITGLLTADLLAFAGVAALETLAIQGGGPAGWVAHQGSLLGFPISFAVFAVYLGKHGHYSERLPTWIETRQIAEAGMLALFVSLIFSTVIPDCRAFWSVGWFVVPFVALGLRECAKGLLNGLGLWQIPVLVIGDPQGIRQAVELFDSAPLPGYRIVGSLPISHTTGLTNGSLCRAAFESLGARRIILSSDRITPLGQAIAQSLIRERLPFSLLPESEGLPVIGCRRTTFLGQDTVILNYRDNLGQPIARLFKVTFDVTVASLALLLLSPLFLLLGFMIRQTGGNVFFGHRRVGAKKQSFACLKFRTMVSDSDRVLRELLARNPEAAAEWNATQKLTNDPRITRVGRLLRATSLDELPQLVNIVRLEMSLVGPRPIVPQEVPRYADDIAYYYQVRPGLTGLWQVSGRSDTSYTQRVQLDSWYVRNWEVWNDLIILAKTIPAVLQRKGAR